jgi:hypothetical protein
LDGSSAAAELLDAANRLGNAVKRREDLHRMAESNRAFAQYPFVYRRVNPSLDNRITLV